MIFSNLVSGQHSTAFTKSGSDNRTRQRTTLLYCQNRETEKKQRQNSSRTVWVWKAFKSLITTVQSHTVNTRSSATAEKQRVSYT